MKPLDLINQLDEPDRTIACETLEAANARFEYSKKDQARCRRNSKIRKWNAELKRRLYSEIADPEEARRQYVKARKDRTRIAPLSVRGFMRRIEELEKHRARLSGTGGKGLTAYTVQPDARPPDKWQRAVASVRNKAYWAQLDEFMDDWQPGVAPKDVAHALINCGYHPYDAVLRLTGREANR